MARSHVRTIPPWVTLEDDDFDDDYDYDCSGPRTRETPGEAARRKRQHATSGSTDSNAQLHTSPPQPTAPPRAATTASITTTTPRPGMKHRVSRDGYEEWVDERLHKAHKLPPWMRKRADRPGRRWDHLRSNEPVILGTGYRPPGVDPYAKWRTFMHDSYIPPETRDYCVMPYDYLRSQPQGQDMVHVDVPSNKPTRRQRFTGRVWNWILRHPVAQLVFRLLLLGATMSSLAASTSLYRDGPWLTNSAPEDEAVGDAERNQIVVAVVVDCIAIPYILYMTWDDFTGKPLGLRPPVQKIALTLFDLFFIIWKSASTALAFQTLEIRTDGRTQSLAAGLAALLLVGLVSWVANFTISVLRIVERLGGVEEGSEAKAM
jgi:hypothetical protein